MKGGEGEVKGGEGEVRGGEQVHGGHAVGVTADLSFRSLAPTFVRASLLSGFSSSTCW